MKSATTRFEVVPLSELPRKITSIAGNKPLQGGEGSKVPCEEKARLARAYDLATSRFSEAVRELHRKMGTTPKEEYDRLERVSNQARMSSEQARLALEQHIAAHRC
jgi:hypothetical protein